MIWISRTLWRLASIAGAGTVVLIALLPVATGAQTIPRAQSSATTAAHQARQVASVEGITEYRLPNGLKILLFPDSSKPTVTVNITYLVGSRVEGYGETGMAHLLEHMMFKGTPAHRNIPQELTDHGSRPNASTSFDRTNYFETVPATDANLEWALGLEADRMTKSFIAKKDLESEFSVVRNELETAENSPANMLLSHVTAAAYDWHAYGRTVGGARSDIEGVPIERLQAFYHKYYQPDNAVLVVAGKFNPVGTLRTIEQKFGGTSRPVRSLAAGNLIYQTYTTEPTQDGERSVVTRRVGDAPLVVMAHHVPAGSHPDFAAVAVLARVLGDNPSGRLYKALVEPKLAASANTFLYQLREPSLLYGVAQLRAGQSPDSVAAAMAAAFDQAARSPVTSVEVERAKAFLLKDLELELNNSELVGFSLTEWEARGDWRLMFLQRDRFEQVTVADVQRVAAAYLKLSNRTIGVFVPTATPNRSEIPAAPGVASMVAGYKGRAALQSGEVFDPSPVNIESRIKRTTLPSGLQLQLLPKQTRGDRVLVQIQLRYGTEITLNGKAGVSELTSSMLSRGTMQLSRQQLKDSLDNLKATVTIRGAVNTTTVNVETTRPYVLPVLDLVAQQLHTPRFDQADFEKMRQERLVQLEQSRGEPQVIAINTLQRKLLPKPSGHPLYQPTPAEQSTMFNAASLDQVKAFHRDFYGASFGDAAVIGSFDVDSVRSAMIRYFGGWQSTSQFERLTRNFAASDSGTTVIETPDKSMAVLVVAQTLAITDTDAVYPALIIANEILGGGFLNSRLAMRIRQKEGISYGVGTGLSVQTFDRYGELQTFAIFAPQNVDRLVAAFREEVQRVLTDGFTRDEVEAAKSSYLQQRLQTRANDGELIMTLIARRSTGRTMAFDDALDAQIRALTVDNVNAAARKYISMSNMIQVRAGDFAKHPPVSRTP